MRNLKLTLMLAGLTGSMTVIPTAEAQWAVVDAPAIIQLIKQVENAEQQLAAARNQVLQAQQAFQAMSGVRGMQNLLSGTVRNYLPSNWSQVTGTLQGSGGFGSLSTDVQNSMTANAFLPPQRLALLPLPAQQLIQGERQWTAMQQAISHQALANASSRFAAIQTLISAIPSASDQKGILDLQARISAELGMVQNEQTKVQLLNQSALAQESVLRQQEREQVIDGHGRFDTRFQPVL